MLPGTWQPWPGVRRSHARWGARVPGSTFPHCDCTEYLRRQQHAHTDYAVARPNINIIPRDLFRTHDSLPLPPFPRPLCHDHPPHKSSLCSSLSPAFLLYIFAASTFVRLSQRHFYHSSFSWGCEFASRRRSLEVIYRQAPIWPPHPPSSQHTHTSKDGQPSSRWRPEGPARSRCSSPVRARSRGRDAHSCRPDGASALRSRAYPQRRLLSPRRCVSGHLFLPQRVSCLSVLSARETARGWLGRPSAGCPWPGLA